MFADRIRRALDVLAQDPAQVRQTVRQQASAYLGEKVDDACLDYMRETAVVIYADTFEKARAAGFNSHLSQKTALCNVLIGGMAIGKRLGIDDGEKFAREVEDLDAKP